MQMLQDFHANKIMYTKNLLNILHNGEISICTSSIKLGQDEGHKGILILYRTQKKHSINTASVTQLPCRDIRLSKVKSKFYVTFKIFQYKTYEDGW